MSDKADSQLGPLPDSDWTGGTLAYTAEQMRAYALQERAAERERWKTALNPVMFADFKCWHQNADAELPEVAAWVIQNLRDRLAEYEGPKVRAHPGR